MTSVHELNTETSTAQRVRIASSQMQNYYSSSATVISADDRHLPLTIPAPSSPTASSRSPRACFNVQRCTNCAVMNENVQWRNAVFVMMSHEEIKILVCIQSRKWGVKRLTERSFGNLGWINSIIYGEWLKKEFFWGKWYCRFAIKMCSDEFSLKHALRSPISNHME